LRGIKRFFRGCLSSVFFIIYGLGSLVIGFGILPILFLFGSRVSWVARLIIRVSYIIFVWLAKVLRLFRVEVDKASLNKIKSVHSHVVVANHPSLIDIVILTSLLPPSTGFAKKDAARNPFYSRVVKSVFIPNEDPAIALEEGIKALKSGLNVIIFPQGTRTRQGEDRKLHRGAANVALRAGVPVLPIRIKTNVPVLGKSQPWWDVGSSIVVYTIEAGDVLFSDEAPSRAAAIELTKRIGKEIN
jgi:1-acyl-sn-glycerol-3-phosphate acyltransferase